MANWKASVDLYDLLSEDRSDEAAQHIGRTLAARLKAKRIGHSDDELEDLIDRLEYVDDCDELNGILDELYDWGDVGHRLWINTVGPTMRAKASSPPAN